MTVVTLVGAMAGPALAAAGNPTTECGPNPLFNKVQINNGNIGNWEFSTPPGQVIELEEGDVKGTFDWENTSDEYIVVLIVLKSGLGDGDGEDLVVPSGQSGTLSPPADISHITFCFAKAPEPEPPVVTATIVCAADDRTGEATYTLQVEAPAGVTTEPEDGSVIENVDTTVTVTWEGGTFDVVAEATEDCSFTPEEPPVPPTVTAQIVCAADAETGEATYTLDINAPEGVTTDPADGTVVENVDTAIEVTWEGGTFEVVAEATEDCSFTPEQPPVPPTVTAEIVCVADAETGEARYFLDVEAPEGVTTDPVDGAEIDNVDTPVTVTWEGGTFDVTAEATDDCTESIVLPRIVRRTVTPEVDTEVEGEQLARTGSSATPLTTGILFLVAGWLLVMASTLRVRKPVALATMVGWTPVVSVRFDRPERHMSVSRLFGARPREHGPPRAGPPL